MKKNKKLLLCTLSGVMAAALVGGAMSFADVNASAEASAPVFTADFEGDLDGFQASGGQATATLVTETPELDCAYSGTQAMQVHHNSAFVTMGDDTEEGSWLTSGGFFELSFWAKVAVTPDTYCPVRGMLNYWYMTPEGNWKGANSFMLFPGNTVESRVFVDKGWTKFSATFGVYGDGTNFYAYNNGTLELVESLAGYLPAYQSRLDLGSNSGVKDFYCDDLTIVKTTVEKDVTLSVLDGATGAIVTGATIVVCDENGVALATQPVVEENEGVYTVKGLSFENFTSSYILQVKDGEKVVGTAQASVINTELSVSTPYTGTVTVKDADGNFVTDATLTYGDVTLTENENGVYTLEDLTSAVTVQASREGFISKIVNISAATKDVEVVLKKEIPAIEVEDNLVPVGNLDGKFPLSLNSQGAVAAVTPWEQYEGIQSLKVTAKQENGTAEVRLGNGTALNTTGTNYYYEFMAKSDTNTTLSYSINFVCTKDNGYRSVMFMSEPVQLSSEWSLHTMEFSVRYDETTNKIYTIMNGGEEVEFAETVSGIAAIDMRFTLSDGEIFVDNLTILETYSATVTVKDEEGNAMSGATFELIDHAGRTSAITPTYDEATGKYTFVGLKGNVKVVATVGDKTYSAVTLSRKLTNVDIETAYTIHLTLKDQNGNPVIGAKVKARKGLTIVGDFVDNGDGTYTLEGAMGTVSIVIIVNGYDFERQDNVSIDNATLTVIGEKYATEDVGGDEPASDNTDNSVTSSDSQSGKKKGCGSFIGAPITVLAASAMVILCAKKRKED